MLEILQVPEDPFSIRASSLWIPLGLEGQGKMEIPDKQEAGQGGEQMTATLVDPSGLGGSKLENQR